MRVTFEPVFSQLDDSELIQRTHALRENTVHVVARKPQFYDLVLAAVTANEVSKAEICHIIVLPRR